MCGRLPHLCGSGHGALEAEPGGRAGHDGILYKGPGVSIITHVSLPPHPPYPPPPPRHYIYPRDCPQRCQANVVYILSGWLFFSLPPYILSPPRCPQQQSLCSSFSLPRLLPPSVLFASLPRSTCPSLCKSFVSSPSFVRLGSRHPGKRSPPTHTR